jgi:uncharacterized protein YcnI
MQFVHTARLRALFFRHPEETLGITAIAVAFIILMIQSASAHVTLETGEVVAGSGYKAVLRVPHGCEGSATTRISVKIPEGVIGIKPQPHYGWKVEAVTGKYAKAYDFYGHKLEEGVVEVTWSSGNLPDAYYDEFVLSGMVSAEVPPGALYFPVVQECEKGVNRWIEVPAAGQSEHDLKQPAPALNVLPKQ